MAFNDSWTGRRGILGWGIGDSLPTADGSVGTDIDAQLYLGLPGQHDIENPNPPGSVDGAENRGPWIGIGIGFA